MLSYLRAYRPDGVIASLDYGVFLFVFFKERNCVYECLFLLCAWAAIRGGEEGLRSGYDPRCLHILSCFTGHNKTGFPRTQPLSHATMPGVAGWLAVSPIGSPLINSQGLSAGRSGADSWMRRSGMPRYSVRASCSEKRGWGGLGGVRALAVFARRTSILHVYMPTV